MRALLNGQIGRFFDTLPIYGAGGSIVLRAPFAALGQLFAGGEHAEYRLGALECLLAASGLLPLVLGPCEVALALAAGHVDAPFGLLGSGARTTTAPAVPLPRTV